RRVRPWRHEHQQPAPRRALVAELGGPAAPAEDLASGPSAARADAAAARWLSTHASAQALEGALSRAAAERASAMWPWETEPHSAASGILDDETYDYLAVVRATLETGGWPVVAAEATVLEAHRLGTRASFAVSATGTAGLAGALTLAQADLLDRSERVAVMFTGVAR
ncbi:MAG TPA: hypothetical protein PKU97_19110, partial [Kofleriaceae bacterium]|nr:hypothetical protein [Kofleriaceae bacterium]